MASIRIPLNIKRFYFCNDLISGVKRTRVKNYYDENGNKIYSKPLYTFDDLYIVEGTYDYKNDGKNVEFVTGPSKGELEVVYQSMHWNEFDENGKEIEHEYHDREWYSPYTKISNLNGNDYDYCVYNGRLFTGAVFLDANDEYIVSRGSDVGTYIGKKLVVGVHPYKETKNSDVSVIQIKGNSTFKFEENLPELYIYEEIEYIDDNGNTKYATHGYEGGGDDFYLVDTVTREYKNGKIIITYSSSNFDEDVVEEYNINGKIYLVYETDVKNAPLSSSLRIDIKPKKYLDYYHEKYPNKQYDEEADVTRELWVQFFMKSDIDIPDTSDEPETKGGE